MIKTFRHAGIEKFFLTGSKAGLQPKPAEKLSVRLQVSRTTLSRVLNGRAGIWADMSLRLADALGTHAAFWSAMQMEYDLWQARRKASPKIEPFHAAA